MTRSLDATNLELIYRERFGDDDLAYKTDVWKILCQRFFQRFISTTDTVLDLAAGTCEFINHIDADRKIAVDLNPAIHQYAKDAEVIVGPSTDLAGVDDGQIDVVFSSNFFEHLPSKDDLIITLQEIHRVLRTGGILLILMPNIRYLPGAYWDYFDHHIPLSDRSLAEALTICNFDIRYRLARFLPYTVKDSRLPRGPLLVRAYLAMPFVWPLLGRQMFFVARRPRDEAQASEGLGRQ